MNIFQAQQKFVNHEFRLKSDFMKMDSQRSGLISRCERYAGWSLPNIFPRDIISADGADEMQYDYQSIGAMAVTNLANKIMMALFQPTRPFFKMDLTDEQEAEVMADGIDAPELEEMLAGAERAAMKRLTKKGGRVALTDSILHLIITGNVLLATPESESLGVYSLRDYVVTRDLRGEVVKLIIKETKQIDGLSDELQLLANAEAGDPDRELSLYTCAQRIDDSHYIVWQELEDFAYAHRSIGRYAIDDLPWLALTWNLPRNANYGNGLVENYAGSFHTASTLAETILDFAIVVTDVKNLVNPAGMTDVETIAQAASGDYIPGREDDLFSYSPQVGQAGDFLNNQLETVKRELATAFLMNSLVTRDAERVDTVALYKLY